MTRACCSSLIRSHTPLPSPLPPHPHPSPPQVRGSIPLYWTQEGSSLQVKPDIVVQQFDPLYSVTAAHLADLRQRYGDPIVVLNLLKSREKRAREGVLRKALAEAITLINGAVGGGCSSASCCRCPTCQHVGARLRCLCRLLRCCSVMPRAGVAHNLRGPGMHCAAD
jgi:hypothetical protein